MPGSDGLGPELTLPASAGRADPRAPAVTFGLRLLVFLLPLLIAWLGLEWWMQRVPTSHSVKHRNLERLAGEIDTLILGSSSGYWDIAPELLPGTAFNLANVAQTPYYDDRLAMQVLPSLPKLRRVIVAVPYVTLFFQLHGTDEEERQYYYYQEWNVPPPRVRDRIDIRMWSAVALRSPGAAVDSLHKALVSLARGQGFVPPPLDPPIDARGWSPREPGIPEDLSVAAVEKKLAYHHGVMHRSDEPANLAALEHLAATLRSHDVEVLLVTPPVWHVYSGRMRQDYWSRAQRDIAQLASRPGVRYLSFLTAPDFAADEFMDADHLNQRGALHFTRLLRDAIDAGAHRPSGP